MLYVKIENKINYRVALYLTKMIKELNLFDFKKTSVYLKIQISKKQKIDLGISTFDKSFYYKKDTEYLNKTEAFFFQILK